MNTQPNAIAQGGFNTGRLYAREGQFVYWWLVRLEDGAHVVLFKDRSRMVHGLLAVEVEDVGLWVARSTSTAMHLMRAYDGGHYENWMAGEAGKLEYALRAPEDYAYGPSLRI